MTADTLEQDTLHQTSLAVWDIPTPAAGERFSIKVGAKSSAGCALGDRRIEVLNGEAVVAAGTLGDTPWPGTDALFWTGVELRAPGQPGLVTLSVHFDAAEIDEPHESASAPFNVSVVAKPEHTLTVKVVADGTPVEDAIVRLGPTRATTDASGMAAVKLAKGRYELVVWKAGYDAPVAPLTIDADAFVQIDARAVAEPDPDAVWTA
jgi:hypothetical protein